MGKTNSDIWTSQSATGKTVTDTTRFLRYTAGSNVFELSEGDDIKNYFDTEGYLNESDITANSSVYWRNAAGSYESKPVMEIETKPSKMYFGGGFIYKSGNSQITTSGDISCLDATGVHKIEIASGTIKELTNAWAEGSGASVGALDTGTARAFKLYSIYAIYNATTEDSDILCVEGGNTPSMPSGYGYKREIARIFLEASTVISKIYDFYQIYNTTDFATNILPFKHYEGFEITKSTGTVINIFEGATKDNTDETDIFHRTPSGYIQKTVNIAWSAGDAGGLLDTGSIASDTQYYLYTILNPTTGAFDFLMSLSATAPTMPGGFTYKKMIGFLKTLSGYASVPATNLYIIWNITDKWEDENFDISSIAKDASIVTSAPSYEALFSGSSNTIKVATFDTGSPDHYIDGGVEYPHGAKDDMPIQFHAHCYPEDANAGNIVLFLDYIITDESDTNAAAAPTRLTVTDAVPGALGEHFTVTFDWIFPSNLEEGSQIWFTFGRLSTDASDTYASKIAIRTFGFHYLTDKRGSDLVTSDL